MRPLAAYVARRLLIIPLSLLAIATLAFGLVSLIPGDPASAIVGDFATPDQIEQIHRELGLDQPLPVRYVQYLQKTLRGDFGTSFFSKQPVAAELARFLPNTIELVVLSLAFAALLGLVVGGIGAYFHRRWPDWVASSAVAVIQSIPDFVLALVLIYVVFFLLRLAPAPVGRLALNDPTPPRITNFLIVDCLLSGNWALLGSVLRHAMLPVVTLGVVYSAYFAKTTRTTLAQALESPQVEFARACGLSEWQVVRYAFLAARTPILTYGAILFGTLVGGAAIVETVFSWRGVGQWALEAMLKVDVPIIQTFTLVAGLITLLVYLALDVLVALLDPRVSYG